MRILEYFTSDHSTPPTLNFAYYPIRVDGTTKHDRQNDPRFPFPTKRFIDTNNSLSIKRKELELKCPQNSNMELKLEVEVKF